MKIKKSELLAALEKVKPGIAGKELIEQSTSFTFLEGRVATYNDEISISHPVPGLDVTGAVKAEALYGYLNRVKHEDIAIGWEDNQVTIKAGKAKAGMAFESEIKLPLKEEIGELEGWKKVPANLLEALKFAHPICSADMSRPILTCVHVTPDYVEATDGYQIARHNLTYGKGVPGMNDSFLLPASAVRNIIRYAITEYILADSWVHFKTGDGTVISSRIVHGEFPGTEPHLRLGDGMLFEFPKETKEVLERADVFTKKDVVGSADMPVVTVTITEYNINISSQNEFGWFSEDVTVDFKGNPTRFKVGSEFMLSIIDRIRKCEISGSKIGFQGADWVHVVSVLVDEGA